MRAGISKIITLLFVLGLITVSGGARHRRCRQETQTSANKREEKPPAAVDKSSVEEKAEAEEEACAAGDEKTKPEGAVEVGMLSGKAISLPKPAYPKDTKVAKASGMVEVNVVTNEQGRVIWARAVSGHPLLQAAAAKAACRARFTPSTRSGRAVKTETFITYNFVAQ
jgi:TonB family protein